MQGTSEACANEGYHVVVHGMNFIPYRIQIKGDKEGITNYTVSCYQVTLPFLLDLFLL
jgi:hypothetical protein